MAVRDVLPVNGASAYNIPDPQARVAIALHVCANPKCEKVIYKGDLHECYDDLHFCDEGCVLAWLRWEGVLRTVYAGEEC